MKQKLMITGAQGFLGARLCDYYKNSYEVFPVSHRDVDITDEEDTASLVNAVMPDIVLHCAAISDTGTCEREQELSYRVNVLGTMNIGRVCKETGSRLVVMSSDQIYTGSTWLSPNRETQINPPSNVYGTHKLQAEEMLLDLMPEAVCLRLTWMYDMWIRGRKINRNLFRNLTEALIEGRTYYAPVHEYRGITDVGQVVRQMEQAWSLPGGVYNFGSCNEKNTYQITEYLMSLIAPGRGELLKPDEERYKECPRNLSMDMKKTEKYGIHFTDTERGFLDFLEEYGW